MVGEAVADTETGSGSNIRMHVYNIHMHVYNIRVTPLRIMPLDDARCHAALVASGHIQFATLRAGFFFCRARPHKLAAARLQSQTKSGPFPCLGAKTLLKATVVQTNGFGCSFLFLLFVVIVALLRLLFSWKRFCSSSGWVAWIWWSRYFISCHKNVDCVEIYRTFSRRWLSAKGEKKKKREKKRATELAEEMDEKRNTEAIFHFAWQRHFVISVLAHWCIENRKVMRKSRTHIAGVAWKWLPKIIHAG